MENKESKSETKELIQEAKNKELIDCGELKLKAYYLQEGKDFAGAINLYGKALEIAKGDPDMEASIKAPLGVLLLNSTQYIIDALKIKNTPRHIWHFVAVILSNVTRESESTTSNLLRAYLKDPLKLDELRDKIIEARDVSRGGEYGYDWRLTP